METFKYKKYENCYFVVSNYMKSKNAVAIMICNDYDGQISTCTTYIDEYVSKDLATIKNYSENSKMTDFLQELGIIKEIVYRFPCNAYPETLASLQTDNPQTIDICTIDFEKLKEHSKVFKRNA